MCSRLAYGGAPDGEKLGWLERLDPRAVAWSEDAHTWLASSRQVRPTDGVLALRTRGRTARPHAGPARRLDVVRWGLVPRAWTRPLRELPATWNARSETVATLPSYAPAWRCARRCVLLVSAAVEFPKGRPGGPPRPRGVPAPRVAITRADGGPLALAGLWEAWRRPGVASDAPDAWLLSCTLLTTTPNAAMAPVHHRMPVVLDLGDVYAWLDPELPLGEAHARCIPCADEVLRVEPVAPPAVAA